MLEPRSFHPSRILRRVPALILILACLDTFPATAQTVRGRLLDAATAEPVPGAVVRLLAGDAGGSELGAVVTDSTGGFRLRASRAGRHRLRAERIGYRTVTSAPFDVAPDASLQVELRIAVEAIPLAPLTVVSERRLSEPGLEARGYYERKDAWGTDGTGFGHFVDGDEIRRTNPLHVWDVLRGVPGVHVEGVGGHRQQVKLRSVTSITGERCRPNVYLDGVEMRRPPPEAVRTSTGARTVAADAFIDELITASSLAAVEVYPGLTAPAEFMGDEICGAVVLWTRRGLREGEGSPFNWLKLLAAAGVLALVTAGLW